MIKKQYLSTYTIFSLSDPIELIPVALIQASQDTIFRYPQCILPKTLKINFWGTDPFDGQIYFGEKM